MQGGSPNNFSLSPKKVEIPFNSTAKKSFFANLESKKEKSPQQNTQDLALMTENSMKTLIEKN